MARMNGVTMTLRNSNGDEVTVRGDLDLELRPADPPPELELEERRRVVRGIPRGNRAQRRAQGWRGRGR